MEHFKGWLCRYFIPEIFIWLTDRKGFVCEKVNRGLLNYWLEIFDHDSWFLSQLSRVSVRSIFGGFEVHVIPTNQFFNYCRELHWCIVNFRRLIDKTDLHDVWQKNFKIASMIVWSSLCHCLDIERTFFKILYTGNSPNRTKNSLAPSSHWVWVYEYWILNV